MTQMTVDQAYARKLANSILSEFGLERAQEYALRMMGSVCSETLRKRWSEVLQQINEIAHPLRFRADLLPLVFSVLRYEDCHHPYVGEGPGRRNVLALGHGN